MSEPEFRAPVGTRDVLPPESARWARLVLEFAARAECAGYGLVFSPMFEDIEVFTRVGRATDVVTKEMYELTDKGGRRLALRPEGTASIVRAWVQHRPPLPFKAWYFAPGFRYERPQAGRFRQHHQVGVEALGTADPDLDVEVVALATGFCAALGLQRVALALNSLGDPACRPAYLQRLSDHIRAGVDGLCDEHRDRWEQNPLRVLDCKRPTCQAVTADAPGMVEHLCPECAAHFARVLAGLDRLGVAYRLEPRLVRGLDYYTRTTFEFVAEALETSQNGVGGGGRYDGLTEAMGGPATPGIGFGMGIERLLLACDAEASFATPDHGPVLAWVVDTTGGSEALAITHELRAAGIGADRAFDARSMKAQFKAADRSGARVAVIVGERERAESKVSLRDLQTGDQVEVSRADLIGELHRRSSD